MRKLPRNSDMEPRSNSKSSAPKRRRSAQLFGRPLLLEGEDAAAYDLLFAQVFAAIKPVDVIDEMLINDLVALQWEVLRWRRLKLGIIRAKRLHSIENHLRGHLEYEVYEDTFTDDLAEIIQDSFPKLQSEAMGLGCVKTFRSGPKLLPTGWRAPSGALIGFFCDCGVWRHS